MENYPNPYKEIYRRFDNLEKQVDLILRRTGKVDLFDEFNINGLKNAIKVLGYKSTKTLSKKNRKGGHIEKK